MKKIILFSLVVLIYSGGCRTQKPVAMNGHIKPITNNVTRPTTDYSSQSTWLLGYFNPARLKDEPYSGWYNKGYDDYQINTEAINNLLDISKEGLSIKVIMGTWCPDSRREVPRFMRVLDAWHFPVSNVTFIGVDDGKRSPVGEYASLNIQRVPTFIVYKNNVESGRIIENPVASLEQDLVKILTRNE